MGGLLGQVDGWTNGISGMLAIKQPVKQES